MSAEASRREDAARSAKAAMAGLRWEMAPGRVPASQPQRRRPGLWRGDRSFCRLLADSEPWRRDAKWRLAVVGAAFYTFLPSRLEQWPLVGA